MKEFVKDGFRFIFCLILVLVHLGFVLFVLVLSWFFVLVLIYIFLSDVFFLWLILIYRGKRRKKKTHNFPVFHDIYLTYTVQIKTVSISR